MLPEQSSYISDTWQNHHTHAPSSHGWCPLVLAVCRRLALLTKCLPIWWVLFIKIACIVTFSLLCFVLLSWVFHKHFFKKELSYKCEQRVSFLMRFITKRTFILWSILAQIYVCICTLIWETYGTAIKNATAEHVNEVYFVRVSYR